ncbi:DUF2798 domain-containing protein [Acinetobacter baumannii]|uniref:DUF2798 domain-containing protein n=1 Tax=Acinetobacter baumannii TaxID=470 RepID=UPI0037D7A661
MSNSRKEIKTVATIASVVTSYITFILVALNLGFTNKFLFAWLRSWAIAATLVFLSILFVAPIIRIIMN